MSVCGNCGKPLIYGDIDSDEQVIGVRMKGVYSMIPIDFCSDKCLNEKYKELDKYEELEKK